MNGEIRTIILYKVKKEEKTRKEKDIVKKQDWLKQVITGF